MTTTEASSARPFVASVVIPGYGCAGTIAEVLKGLFKQTAGPLEIIVVNDRSPDDLDGAVEPYRERIVYIKNDRNLGLAATCNAGLRRASAEFVMTLHSDCILDPDYVEKMLGHFKNNTKLGAVSGQYLFDDPRKLALSDRMFLALNRIPVETERLDTTVEPVNFIEGKADLFRREVIARYGFFNENLILTAEDQELSAKMRADGYQLLQDAGCRFRVKFTETSSSLWKILRKQRTYARGQVYVALKFRGNMFAKTTANRRERARHRLSQLVAAPLMAASLLASAIAPASLWLFAGILAWRLIYYFTISPFLGISDRLLAAVLGPVADFLYAAGAVEGFVKTALFRKT